MATTPYMTLSLPTPSVTVGPAWAQQLIDALTLVDSHNHTSGQGVQVPTAGMNINADLSFGGFNATTLRSSRFASNAAVLALSTDVTAVYVAGGDLYYNNSAGTPVQITAGTTLAASSFGGISGLSGTSGSAAFNAGTGTFTFWQSSNVSGLMDVGAVTIHATGVSAPSATLTMSAAATASYTLTLPVAVPGTNALLCMSPTGALSFLTGSTASGAALTLSGSVTINANLSASGTLTINGPATLTSSLSVAGVSTLTGGATVAGTTTTNGALVVNGSFTTNGPTTLVGSQLSLSAAGGSYIIKATSANTLVSFTGNRDAGYAGDDVAFGSTATRTAGNIVAIYNAGNPKNTFGYRGHLAFPNAENPGSSEGWSNTLTPKHICKAWGLASTDGSGGASITEGINIASATIVSNTVLRINFTNAMADANWVAVGNSGGASVTGSGVQTSTKNASYVEFFFTFSSGNLHTRAVNIDFILFGAQ